MRTKFMDELMNEVVCYGGMAATRHEVYRHALAACLSDPDCPSESAARKAADRFAFGPQAVTLSAEQAAALPQFDPETGEPKGAEPCASNA